MARPIWKGAVSFGMVSIPVGLYPTVSEKDVRFHQIHRECGSRIKLQKWCPVHERALSPDEIVKGYEISKGRYVLMEEEDLENVPVPSKHTVSVDGFVDASEVDPVYFDSAYYLEPEETGRRPYALLLKALQSKKVAAIAKIAMRQKESLCLLRATEGRIVLETLHYPDEIRKLEPAKTDFDLDERELKMAESLVDLLREEFQPEKYKDEVRDAILERIEAKAHGESIAEQPEPKQTAQVIDLFEALKRSVEAAKKERPEEPKRKKAA
ncbi:MAG TPA: Ku protein [Fimbriimonas sp.]